MPSSARTTCLVPRCGHTNSGCAGADVATGITVDVRRQFVIVVGTTSSVLPGLSPGRQLRRLRPLLLPRPAWGAVVPPVRSSRAVTTPGGWQSTEAGGSLWWGARRPLYRGRRLRRGLRRLASQPSTRTGSLPDGLRQFGSAGDDFGVAVAIGPARGRSPSPEAPTRPLPGKSHQAGTTAFLRHFDVVWRSRCGPISSAAGIADEAWDVAIDAGGNTTLVGTTARVLPGQRSAGGTDAFVRTYDRWGHETWTFQYGTTEDDSALAVALLDGADGIVIAGGSRGALGDRRPENSTPTYATRPAGPPMRPAHLGLQTIRSSIWHRRGSTWHFSPSSMGARRLVRSRRTSSHFFTRLDKEPDDVSTADVLGFIRYQRLSLPGDPRQARILDRQLRSVIWLFLSVESGTVTDPFDGVRKSPSGKSAEFASRPLSSAPDSPLTGRYEPRGLPMAVASDSLR